jgi:hypothetical protein
MADQIKNIENWLVNTPSGWKEFSGIKEMTAEILMTFIFSDGSEIAVTPGHLLKFPNGEFLEAVDILEGDELFGGKVVQTITYIESDSDVYDLLGVDGEEYYTSGVVSHNCAFIDRSEEVWAASQMTLSTGGDAIVLSTPNGVGNVYHKLYTSATEGKQVEGLERFNPICLPWHLHPERDQKWRDLQDELLGPRLASQECDGNFLTSGHTVIEGEVLSWYLENTKEPLQKRGMTLDYWLWNFPEYTRDYVVFADVGRGDGNDNSSFQVLDVETLEQVAEYDGQMGTREFGNFLVAVATEWNNALLCINNRNIGWDVVQQAIERMYPNLYYSYRNDPYLDPNIHIRKNLDLRDKSDKVPGFTETAPIRNVAVSKLVTYLSEKSVKINSKRLINQLFVFIWYNGKAQAANGYHDDLVIAYMYELFMHDIALKLRTIGIEMTKKALSGTFKSVYKPTTSVPAEWQQQIGNKSESLTWLL